MWRGCVQPTTAARAPPRAPWRCNPHAAGRQSMATVTVGSENSNDIDLYFEDHGSGQPVVLIHGYPLNGRSWERQERALLAAATARSTTTDADSACPASRPSATTTTPSPPTSTRCWSISTLNDIVLVGFSMGTGEVTRYLGHLRLGPGAQGRAARRDPAVPAARPTTTPRASPARSSRASRQRSSRTATPTSRTSSTTSTTSTSWRQPDQRPGLAGQLQRRRGRLAVCDAMPASTPG